MPHDAIPLLPRGVYPAPCLGPHREKILFAVRSDHCHIAQEDGGVIYLAPGDNPFMANARLWELLDRVDPIPQMAASA